MAKKLRLFADSIIWNPVEQDPNTLSANIQNAMDNGTALPVPLENDGWLVLKADALAHACLFQEEEVNYPALAAPLPFRYPGSSSIDPVRMIMGAPMMSPVRYPGVSSIDPWRIIMGLPG